MKERSCLSNVLLTIICIVFALTFTSVLFTIRVTPVGLGLKILMLCFCHVFVSFTLNLKDPTFGTVGLLLVSFLAVSLLVFYLIVSSL